MEIVMSKNGKQTSKDVSSLASDVLRDPHLQQFKNS
jgi:hypothetical protein